MSIAFCIPMLLLFAYDDRKAGRRAWWMWIATAWFVAFFVLWDWKP